MPLLAARNLTMSYPGVRALGGVDFELRAGEIHALCGENGAGKSTLIKILCGVIPHGAHSHEGGGFTLDGVPCHFALPVEARRAGIRVIHQELALCPDLSVADNVFLGEEPLLFDRRWGLPDTRRMERKTRAQLDALGLSGLDPRARVGTLPVGLRQMVEIARALRPAAGASTATRVLILDEPTSALSAREAARLEETLRGLRGEGVAILYISHRLDEVFRLADRITVLRNGESAGTIARSESGAAFDPDRIVAMMVGGVFPSDRVGAGSPRPYGASPPPPSSNVPLLSVRNWTVPSPNPDRNVVQDVSFDLRAGEILGFAGLMGAGRTELVESLCGLHSARGRGAIRVNGNPYAPRDAAHALRHGLALLCEDRRAHALFPAESVRGNMTLSALRAFCAAGWLTREDRERAAARAQIDALRIKAPGAEFPAGHLSGGNQQKVLLARALLTRPRILILDEPTRGIDVGAKEELYALITRLAAEGMGILLISSEMEEVLRLSHRVIILRCGRVVTKNAAERAAHTLDLEATLALAAGGTP